MVTLYNTGTCPPTWTLMQYDNRYLVDDNYTVPMYYSSIGSWTYRVCFRTPNVQYTASDGKDWPMMITCCYQVTVLPFHASCRFPHSLGYREYNYPHSCMRSSWIFNAMYPIVLNSVLSFPYSSATSLAPPSMWSSLSGPPSNLADQYTIEQQAFQYCTAAGYDGYGYYLNKRPIPSFTSSDRFFRGM